MVMTQTVSTFTGKTISVPLRSLCVHGDTPGGGDCPSVRDALEAEGIGIYCLREGNRRSRHRADGLPCLLLRTDTYVPTVLGAAIRELAL